MFTNGSRPVLIWVCVCATACSVYDPELVTEGQPVDPAPVNPATPGADAAVESRETGPLSALCGNAALDPGEKCDIAIPRSMQGACPDGCSGRTACTRHELRGKGCEARCESIEIVADMDGDGCCRPDASAASDSDCAALCGNGMVEPGEHCDPVASCARPEACIDPGGCWTAKYSGDPELCTAVCELMPTVACVNDDGCCPAGCTFAQDQECEPPLGDACPDGGCNPEAPSEPAAEDSAAVSCASMHAESECEVCDCGQCQERTLACLTAPGTRGGALCHAIVRCAEENHCDGLDCYCGSVSLQNCGSWPIGPCVREINAAAGTSNAMLVYVTGTLMDSPISRANSLMACRSEKCASACGL